MLVTALLACTPDVRGLYERERTDALEVASERPASWSPDVRIQIAERDFEDAVATAVRAAVADPPALTVSLPLGVEAKVRPQGLTVQKAEVRGSDACASCLALDAEVSGRAAWSLAGATGSVPFDLSIDAVVALEVADGRTVRARPRSVGTVKAKVGDSKNLAVNPSKELQEWARRAVGEKLPPITLVDLDPADLPLRDLRLRTDGGAVTIEALSDVPGSTPAADGGALASGVRVSLSESALAGLARRAAFRKGVIAMDVAADPRGLSLVGDRFTLHLRLWRLVGRGWWRDYEVTGTVSVAGGKLQLRPDTTREVAASRGAGLVDPLVLLVEGRVLDAITDAVRRTLPASRAQDVGTVRLKATAEKVTGRDGTLFVEGDLTVQSPERR